MKNAKFRIYFIKTVFDTYPITEVEADEKYIEEYITDNIIKNCGVDILDILYNDELKFINVEQLSVGNYIIEGELIIIHLYNGEDFEFINLKLYEDKSKCM